MATANRKSTIDTHTKIKRIPNTTLKLVIRSQEKKKKKRTEKNYKNYQKTNNKMAITAYL